MKILLIRPNSEVPSAAPPLGLMYLSSYIREYGNHNVEIFDGRNLESKPEEIAAKIRSYKPDAIGITSFSMENKEAHQVAAMAKEIFPDAPVVMGGPYPTSQIDDAMADANIDVAVICEGEKSGLEVFDALENGGELDNIHEIAFRRNGEIVRTNPVEYIDDLDEIPFPAWDMIDLESYFTINKRKRRTMNQHQMKKRVVQIFTTRGCPYHCAYCHNLFGKKLRYRSIENIIAEMRMLKDKYNIEEIEIHDDIFNLDLKRAKTIFRRIIDEKFNFKFSFPNGLRSDRMDEEFLDLLKEGGAYRLVFAIESGSPRIQKLIKKHVKLETANRNIELAAKRGFSLGGFFMLGFPTETEEEGWQTINFALESKLHTATFFVLTPFPGTEIYDMARDMGYDMTAQYEHYQKVSANVSNIPSDKLVKMRRYALRKFYLNPKRIWGYIRTSPWHHRFFMKLYILIMVSLFEYDK
ncbi:MAG: B12-binding domain-containing radical SAM protein [candidate division Zixibacteria bacterium]|nr:B12-binding domain-containing radical SAM protein [Candidatus Tariuqbacter arcticus]